MAEPTGKDTPTELSRDKGNFWSAELTAAKKTLTDFHKQGPKIVKRFLDERGDSSVEFKLNLFHSNIQTMQDTMYSNLPKVETDRRNADAGDDVARVAASLMERMLNLDLAKNAQKYDAVLRSVLQDRLLPGLGVARVRYECEYETVEIPAQFDQMGLMVADARTEEQMVSEDAPVEYYHWQDVLWGWGRNFAELPWIAYRSYLSKEKCEARFGKKAALIEYKNQKAEDVGDESTDDKSPRSTGEIWEIWDKETSKVRWYNNGTILDAKADPLQLKNFFPSPAFLIANATTTLYRPKADFCLCQDLYNEIDNLQSRISLITEAVKVVGVYDSTAEGVKRMLSEGVENDLIPVDNWAMFAEKGGLKGAVDWFPLADVVNTLDKLIQVRDDTIGLLQQTSGMADVQQGQIRNQYEGVGQTEIKAQYGSVRVQALQDQFAAFAADLMQLKAEVICKHFEVETIAQMSNAQYIFDQQLVPQALQLLKQPDMAHFRIVIRPETIAMIDYAKLKQDRTEFLTALATFMQSAGALLQTQPNAMPYLLKMLQWTMAGFKGSQEIEGVLDQAIDQATKELEAKAGQPQEDPAAQAAQMELQKIQAKSQADMQLRQADSQADIELVQATSQSRMQEIAAAHQAKMEEIAAASAAKIQLEDVQLQSNIQQVQASTDAEMEKDQSQIILQTKAHEMETETESENESEATTEPEGAR